MGPEGVYMRSVLVRLADEAHARRERSTTNKLHISPYQSSPR
jgi:hypothetical protein